MQPEKEAMHLQEQTLAAMKGDMGVGASALARARAHLEI